jgi:hypothetical protein
MKKAMPSQLWWSFPPGNMDHVSAELAKKHEGSLRCLDEIPMQQSVVDVWWGHSSGRRVQRRCAMSLRAVPGDPSSGRWAVVLVF